MAWKFDHCLPPKQNKPLNMNERIRELAAQATKVTEPDDPDYRHEIFDKEKFAELIVKECVSVLNNRFMGDMNREDLEVRRCVVDIKKHFGMNDEPR